MKYYLIKKSQLFAIVCIAGAVILLSVLGTGKIITEVSNQLRSLPIYSVATENQEKTVALGINCAWGNEDIPTILDILDQQKIKATFFLVGDFCDRYPETVKLIYQRGHELGNHSDTHKDMPSLSEEQMEAEIENCSQKIQNLIGMKPELFRCPSGSYNNTVIDKIVSLGYYPIQWSVDSLDWKGKTPEEMQALILPKLTYGDILLFHNDTDYTAAALPEIIEKIKSAGYRFTTVGDLIYRGDYSIDVQGRQWKE